MKIETYLEHKLSGQFSNWVIQGNAVNFSAATPLLNVTFYAQSSTSTLPLRN